MSVCPVCDRAVDALRARNVGVKAGKVVAYCSPECKRKAEGGDAVVEDKDLGVKVSMRTPPKGVPVAIPSGTSGPNVLDSGPVIEITREKSEGASGSGLRPEDAPKTDAAKTEPPAKPQPPANTEKPAKTDDAPKPLAEARSPKPSSPVVVESKKPARREPSQPIQPPPDYDDDDLGPPSEEQPRSNKTLIIVGVVIVVAIGAVVAVKMMSKSHAATTAELLPKPKAEAPPPPPPPSAPKIEAKPAVTVKAALDQATAVLRGYLANTTPRIQRRAAEALSRTGDAAAITALADALAKETSSEIARIDLAYALSRAGDKRGTEALVLSLASQRRDARAEAANQLALLGDVRAAPVLADYLDVSQLRLGAAEHLAHLADPRAIKALEATRADDRSSADDKARAAIALVIAGKTELAPAARELLAHKGWSAFAAGALAGMHDAAARPILVEHLGISQLRVDAARDLRRLEPGLDPLPLLPALLADLASAKDTEQIEAAEAVLLLAGPASWSAYP